MDEHEHPLYQYRPLDFEKHEIRLLKLLPGEFNDEIRVVIFHKSLSEPVIDEPAPDWWEKLKKTLPDGWQAYETVEGRVIFTTTDRTRTSWSHPDPKAEWSLEDGYRIKTPTSEVDFEALSYTWGPHEPLDLITVVLNDPEAPVTSPKKSPPGSPNLGTRLRPWPSSFFSKAARAIPEEPEEVAYVHIRPNLRSALRHLRSRTASRILWCDAICIDQNDFEETAIHVARMNRVYLQAKRVIVWLGPESIDSTYGLETLVKIGKEFEVVHNATLKNPECTHPEWQNQLSFVDWPTRNAMYGILQREWFQRLWIWQECLLANADLQIQCGHTMVSWYHVRRGLVLLREAYLPDIRMAEGMLCHPLRYLPYYTRQTMCTKFGTCRLLAATARSGCADSRDRIYGMLGMFDKRIKNRIVPNYQKTVEEVYQEFFLAYLDVYNSLDLLQLCSLATRELENLPSWIPDLTSTVIKPLQASFAHANTKAHASIVAPGVLAVQGVGAGRVRAVNSVQLRSDKFRTPRETLEVLKNWHDFALEHIGEYPGYSFQESFYTTVIYGWVADRRTWGESADAQHADMQRMLAIPWEDPDLDEKIRDSILLQTFSRDPRDMELFATEDGKLALGPLGTKPGDIVVIIMGSSFAIVLRPTQYGPRSDVFQVVGQAFVFGLIDGEGILGPFPAPWRGYFDIDPDNGGHIAQFKNKDTGEVVEDDPRLEGVDDLETFLSLDALKWRSVDVNTFYLV